MQGLQEQVHGHCFPWLEWGALHLVKGRSEKIYKVALGCLGVAGDVLEPLDVLSSVDGQDHFGMQVGGCQVGTG